MDPNETLRRIRAGVAEALEESGSKRDDLVDELAEAFDNLDGWLSKGGFAPDPWVRTQVGLLAMEKRAYRLRCALREAGVPESLVRSVELGEGQPVNLRTDKERGEVVNGRYTPLGRWDGHAWCGCPRSQHAANCLAGLG